MPNFYYVSPGANVAPNATWTCSAALVAGYDVAWLKDLRPERPARANAANAWFTADFGAAQRVDLLGVIAPTLADGVSLRVQASTVSNFASLAMDVTLAARTQWKDGAAVTGITTYQNQWVDLTAQAGYATGGFRYWRVGTTANTLATFSIAEIVMAASKPGFAYGPQWGSTRQFRRASVTHQTEHGVRLRYDRGVLVREFDLSFVLPSSSATGLSAVQHWFMNCQGTTRPSLIVPDSTEDECYLVVFADGRLPWVRRSWGMVSLGCALAELPTSVQVV